MAVQIYREYRLKFYLNARHYIIIGGNKGDVHPHTWEFTLHIRFGRGAFTEFNTFERGINDYLAPFQNTTLNEMEPFDTILPTLESMTDHFAEEFRRIIHDINGILVRVEASETPTRSYILNIEGGDQEEDATARERIRSDVMDAVLDQIVQQE